MLMPYIHLTRFQWLASPNISIKCCIKNTATACKVHSSHALNREALLVVQ